MPRPVVQEPAQPPLRSPNNNDAIGGRENVPAEETFRVLCHRLTTALGFDGPWLLRDWLITLVTVDRDGGDQPFRAAFRVEKDGASFSASLRIAIHPSGWIEAEVTVEGFAQQSFFIEQAYEEFEVWPPGSPCTAIESGRMGKRCGWVQLEAAFWPHLASLAEGRFVTIAPRDSDR